MTGHHHSLNSFAASGARGTMCGRPFLVRSAGSCHVVVALSRSSSAMRLPRLSAVSHRLDRTVSVRDLRRPTAASQELGDVLCPRLQSLALLISIIVEIIGAVADTFGFVILHGVPDLARDAERRHSGLHRCPQVLRRKVRASQSSLFE
jgi:hypothetical protein